MDDSEGVRLLWMMKGSVSYGWLWGRWIFRRTRNRNLSWFR